MHQHVITQRKLPHFTLRNGGPQQHCDDVHHRSCHPSQNEAVHQQAKINCFQSTQERCRFSGVSQLRQLNVGHDFRAPPVSREEKYCQHPGKTLVPPQPVAGDPLRLHKTCNKERRISGKCGGNHAGSSQPPGNVSARNKKFRSISAGAPAVINSDQ